MNIRIELVNPKESLSKISIVFSAELSKKTIWNRVVVDFIHDKIHIREALQMDDGLKLQKTGRAKYNNSSQN
jgi:hypothetical protein